MRTFRILAAGLVVASTTFCAAPVFADSVRLTNGDTIVGKVVSLDEKQLVLDSENFGEVKIPREKVGIIGLGDKPLAEALGTAAPAGPGASGQMPSLQSPAVRQQIDRLLQQSLGGGMGNMQQQMEQSRRGLEELQRDLGPGSEAQALDGYIKMLEMFGGGSGAPPAEGQSPQNPQQ